MLNSCLLDYADPGSTLHWQNITSIPEGRIAARLFFWSGVVLKGIDQPSNGSSYAVAYLPSAGGVARGILPLTFCGSAAYRGFMPVAYGRRGGRRALLGKGLLRGVVRWHAVRGCSRGKERQGAGARGRRFSESILAAAGVCQLQWCAAWASSLFSFSVPNRNEKCFELCNNKLFRKSENRTS
ncbi:hypothetical protein NPIL_285941 [Nephila pilipes]|uniref:Uncharacterized protein n=1 Tax=Nephila pilipes TaxID=299642 RepID=A0A8X6MLF1_NEPPI|nr:hypothetical protein NPIL_285941 [Nephila pilipes]